jgi:hypothetical protein
MFMGRLESWNVPLAYFKGRVTPSTSFIKLTDNSGAAATTTVIDSDVGTNAVLGATVIYTT